MNIKVEMPCLTSTLGGRLECYPRLKIKEEKSKETYKRKV